MIETPENKDKFEQIYYKYRDLMYYVADQKLSNHHDSEDAVHKAFVLIIKDYCKFSNLSLHLAYTWNSHIMSRCNGFIFSQRSCGSISLK